jgi:putative oxidoreductase
MNVKIVLASRILLGLIFLVFGLNGLLLFTVGTGFIPMPPPSEAMMPVFTGFAATKYLMPLVKILEVLAGLMLLSGLYVNLALVFLAPIIVNIVGIHVVLEPSGAPMSIFITILFLVLFKSRYQDFKALFSKK